MGLMGFYTVSVERKMALIWKELTLATDEVGERKGSREQSPLDWLWAGCGGVWSLPFSLIRAEIVTKVDPKFQYIQECEL